MNSGLDLERRLERWLVEEAPTRAPDRVLAAATTVVDRTNQRHGLGRPWIGWWSALTVRQRLAVALVSLLLVTSAALAVGSLIARLNDDGGPPGLILVRSVDGADPPTAIVIVERRPDGTERDIRRVSAAELGGSPSLLPGSVVASRFGHLALAVDAPDGSSAIAILDLNEGDAYPQRSDLQGSSLAFGPNGTVAMTTADGFGVHDPFTGRAMSARLPPIDGLRRHVPLALDGVLLWAADGSGVLADDGVYYAQVDDTVKAGALGILRPDGTFIPGTVPVVDDGIGARRVDPNGTLLRCAGGYDTCDVPEWDLHAVTNEGNTLVWHNGDLGRHVSDFAWAVDGGLWLLLETTDPGPRKISLVRVATDGAERTVTTFDGVADDPDPSGYFASATFAAMAPDDSALIIGLAGDQGAPGTTWWFDPVTNEMEQVDGAIAGWQRPVDAHLQRPSIARLTPTDASIRDWWADADRMMQIGATSMVLDPPRTATRLVLEASGRDTVEISGTGGELGCPADAAGSYRWRIVSDQLRLTVIDDPCAARIASLVGSFDRSLPMTDGGSPQVPAGQTYRAGAFIRAFTLTVPDGDPPDVWRHDAQAVALSTFTDDDASRSVTIQSARAVASDPCQRLSQIRSLPSGAAGVVDHLDRLGIVSGARGSIVVDGHAATTVRIAAPPDCGDRGLSLFPDSSGRALMLGDRARLILFDLDDGTPIVIAIRTDRADGDGEAWASALIDSLDFP